MAKKSSSGSSGRTLNESVNGLGMKPWVKDALAILVLYVITLVLFSGFIVSDTAFSRSPDSAGSKVWGEVGREIADQEDRLPTWTPYVFLGLPMYGSLSYVHHGWILDPVGLLARAGRYLFGVNHPNLLIFYFFVSGVTMYLFARGVGVGVLGSLLAGLVLLMNPYNVSLMDAGHGSKHWAIALMPLTFLLTHRAVTKRRLLDMGLLGLGIAAQMLTRHVQVVYYALLAAGSYVLVWTISAYIRDRMKALKGLGTFAGGGLLGMAMSAYLYLPVYIYSQFSIRGQAPLRSEGGPAGLDWEYATQWSLHPMEMLQFIVPGWFGIGGGKMPDRAISPETVIDYNLYWGWMPFTQSSLYMGLIPLLLAILAAVVLIRKRGVVQWMAIAGLVATVVSFGRYVPVLYGPMYNLLPFFNKFRVPSMALVVLAVAVALLAGMGLHLLIRQIRDARKDDRLKARWSRGMYILLGVGVLGLLVGLFGGEGPSAASGAMLKEGDLQRYGQQTAQLLVNLRWALFKQSMIETAIPLLFAAGMVLIALRANWNRRTVGLAVAGAVLVFTTWNLMSLDKRFLSPVPRSQALSGMQGNQTTRFLQQKLKEAEEPFRIFPLGGLFQSNLWMRHRIPSVGGYAAVKLRVYQDMLDYALQPNPQAMPNLNVAGMLNARYLVVPGRLPGDLKPVFQDPNSQLVVYENPHALPRAWFVENVTRAENRQEAMEIVASEGFDPAKEAVVMEVPDFEVGGDTAAVATVPADKYKAHSFEVQVSTEAPGFLVVSEIWYPQGWRATIDGDPAKIWRVNYGLRGVAVPAGDHVVRFEFQAPEIRAGFVVSGLAFAAILGLIIAGVIRQRRSADNGESDEA